MGFNLHKRGPNMTKYQEDAFSKMIYNDIFVDPISLDVMISTVTFPPSVIYVPDSYFRPKQSFSSRIKSFVLGVYQVVEYARNQQPVPVALEGFI